MSDQVIFDRVLNNHREYADQHYEWSFGDAAAGAWAISGKSKDSATGYVTAHVLEQPGQYLVSLLVSDESGTLGSYTVTITVADPDTVYAGNSTICVANGNDFTGCPSGALTVGSTTNVAAVEEHIVSGRRVLFRRGDTFDVTETISGAYAGPLTLGAFGSCATPDAQGICANAPILNGTLVADSMFSTASQGWIDVRFMDLSFVDGSGAAGSALLGPYKMTDVLWLRLRTRGFDTPLGNSHWEHRGHDQVTVAECDAATGRGNIIYIGANRLALLGNSFRDPDDSHVARVWHAPMAVISHNQLSGSSINSDTGRHALKLHTPEESQLADPGPSGLDGRSRYIVFSDNLIGSSGPWPVAIGPQSDHYDERVSDVVVERNRFFPGFGTPSCCSNPVSVALLIWARHVTVRNNIFSGDGSDNGYTGIFVGPRGIEPSPVGIRILNNTFYKSDSGSGTSAVVIGDTASETTIRNNLAHFAPTGTLVSGTGINTTEDHNLVTTDAQLLDPDHVDFLLKDFRPSAGTGAFDQGLAAPVFDDFTGTARPLGGGLDLGAFEMQ